MTPTTTHEPIPLAAYPLLLFPRRVGRSLERIREARIVPQTPTPWQLSLGILRMWHRMIFRPETVGTSPTGIVRDTWRARLLNVRSIRFPFLLCERVIAPWDMSGLASSRERIIRHLLGAFHDHAEFVYDLEILACHPGALEELRARTLAIVDGTNRRAEWLRDLVVFEGYHERLLAQVDDAIANRARVPAAIANDPDCSLRGYLAWCAAQPRTPAETLREWSAGRFRVATGLRLRESSSAARHSQGV